MLEYATSRLGVMVSTDYLNNFQEELYSVVTKSKDSMEKSMQATISSLKVAMMKECMEAVSSLLAEKEKQEKPHLGTFKDGELLKFDQMRILNKWYGDKSANWKLVYKGTRDGFSAAKFHEHCDLVGETITVVRVKDNLFGGYASHSWTANEHSTYVVRLNNTDKLLEWTLMLAVYIAKCWRKSAQNCKPHKVQSVYN